MAYSYESDRTSTKYTQLNYLMIKSRSGGKNWRDRATPTTVEEIDRCKNIYKTMMEFYNAMKQTKRKTEQVYQLEARFWYGLRRVNEQVPFVAKDGYDFEFSVDLCEGIIRGKNENLRETKKQLRKLRKRLQAVFVLKDKYRNNIYKLMDAEAGAKKVGDSPKTQDVLRRHNERVQRYEDKIIKDIESVRNDLIILLPKLEFN